MNLNSDTITSDGPMSENVEDKRKVHGLLKSYHGIVYQLQWLLVVALQSQKTGINCGFKFRTEVEETDAGKFDDVVWNYCDNQQKKYNFLQSKHRLNSTEKITLKELLKAGDKKQKNNPFSLQKYFISYINNLKQKNCQKINTYKDGIIENLIIATNITLEESLKPNLKLIQTNNSIIRALQKTRNMHCEKLQCWKINKHCIPYEIKTKLEETYDLIKLAKTLGELIRNHSPFTLPDDLKLYQKALYDNIVDETNCKLSENFINGNNLSDQAKYLREAFMQIEFENKRAYFDIISSHKIIPNPIEIAETLSKNIRNTNNNIIKITRYSKVVKENIDELSGFVLIEDDGIKFNYEFWTTSDSDLPNESIRLFKNTLIQNLRMSGMINVDDSFNAIAQKFDSYRFDIKQFKTCKKELVDETSFWNVAKGFDKFRKTTETHEHKDLPNYNLSDMNDEISEFFDLLIFAVSCSKNLLISFVERELTENFRFIDNEYMAYVFRAEIARSLDLTDSFISSSEEVALFIKKVKRQINKFILMGPTIEYQIKTDLLRVDFSRKTIKKLQLQNFLSNPKEQILVMNSVHVKLSSVKVLQMLKNISAYQYNGSYIFMQIDTILYLQDLVIEAFTDTCNLLIIENSFAKKECDLGFDLEKNLGFDLEEFYKRLSNILCINNAKKIIIIDKGNNLLNQNIKDTMQKYKCREISDKYSNIMNLSKPSCDRIMRESKVIFQGDKIDMNMLLSKEIKYIIKNEILFKIIVGDDILIGDIVTNLKEIRDYYIPRTFCRNISVKKTVLLENDIFAICNINQLKLSQELNKLQKRSSQNIVLKYDKYLKNVDTINYVLLDSKCARQQFSNLCNNFPQKSIHWLKYDTDIFIWQNSQGPLDNLRKHIDVAKFDYKEKDCDFVHEIKLKKIVILSDEPGMGKSTVTTKLASLLKVEYSDKWIIRVNVLYFSTDFKRNIDEKFVIEFMYKVSNFNYLKENENLQLREIIKNTIIQQGKLILKHKRSMKSDELFEIEIFNHLFNNGKVVILLDGFDEICSAHERNVVKLIQILKDTMVGSIFITTRPYNIAQNLENLVSDFTYTLKPFDLSDQRNFLLLYWIVNLKLQQEINQDRAKVFINELLLKFSQVTSDKERDFVSIPLQLRMLADSFQSIFLEFYNSTVHNLNDLYKSKINAKLNLLKLYEEFIKTKFEKIRFQEKKPGSNPDDADTLKIKDREYKIFVDDHRKLALYTLFYNDRITELLSSDDISKIENQLLEDIRKADDKNGIICRVVDGLPIFVHRTFAEYFASSYFWDKFKTCELTEYKTYYFQAVIQKKLIKGEYNQICRFFYFMARNDLLEKKIFPFKTEKISYLLECLVSEINDIYQEYENGGTDTPNGTDDVYNSLSANIYKYENEEFYSQNITEDAYERRSSDVSFSRGFVPRLKLLFKIIECYLQVNESESNELQEIIKRDNSINLLRIASEVGCIHFTKLFVQIGHWELDKYKKELNEKKWYFTPLWLAAKNNHLQVVTVLSNIFKPDLVDKDRLSLKQRIFYVNEINVLSTCLMLHILDGSPFKDLNDTICLPLISALKNQFPSNVIINLIKETDIQVINEFKGTHQLLAPFEIICNLLNYNEDVIKFAVLNGICFDGGLNLLLFEYSVNSLNDPIDSLIYAQHFKSSFFNDEEFLKLFNLIKILLHAGVPFNTKCDTYHTFTLQYADSIYQIHNLLNLILNTEKPYDTLTKLIVENLTEVQYKIDYLQKRIYLIYGQNRDRISLIHKHLQDTLMEISGDMGDCYLRELFIYIEKAKEEIERFSTYRDNKTYNLILTGYEEMLQYDGKFRHSKQKLELFQSLENGVKFLLGQMLMFYIRQGYDILDAYEEISVNVKKAEKILNWMSKVTIQVSTDEILQVLDLNNIKTSTEMQKLIVGIYENKTFNFLYGCWSNLSYVGTKNVKETMKSMTKYINVSLKICSLLNSLNKPYTDLIYAILNENYDEINRILNNIEPCYKKSVINGQNEKCGSPLHYAVYHGNTQLTKILCEHGANTNCRLEGHGIVVSVLGDNELGGVDCEEDDHYSYNSDDGENYKGFSPLHIAVAKGNLDIIQVLLKFGGNISIRNDSGENCWLIAGKKMFANQQIYLSILDILEKNETQNYLKPNSRQLVSKYDNNNQVHDDDNTETNIVFPSTSGRKRKAGNKMSD